MIETRSVIFHRGTYSPATWGYISGHIDPKKYKEHLKKHPFPENKDRNIRNFKEFIQALKESSPDEILYATSPELIDWVYLIIEDHLIQR